MPKPSSAFAMMCTNVWPWNRCFAGLIKCGFSLAVPSRELRHQQLLPHKISMMSSLPTSALDSSGQDVEVSQIIICRLSTLASCQIPKSSEVDVHTKIFETGREPGGQTSNSVPGTSVCRFQYFHYESKHSTYPKIFENLSRDRSRPLLPDELCQVQSCIMLYGDTVR